MNTVTSGARNPLTLVFIDYESWFWSLYNNYGETPNLNSFIQDIKQRGKLREIYVFGDFSKNEIEKELLKLRDYTNLIINCANPNEENKKNYTDFIMLDSIYKTALQNQDVEQYILVTGDGHFHSVVAFLKTSMDKIVGIYGVQGSFSPQLQRCSSWWVEIKPENQQYEYKKVLDTIHWTERKGLYPTFRRTVERCAKYYGIDAMKVSTSLSKLVEDGYVDQVFKNVNSLEIRVLEPKWDLIVKHGIWSSNGLESD
ncbi:MAG: NYN domain-containing protein [Bacillota bacterium]